MLFILLRSNPYISNFYILNPNPRLSYHTVGVTYSDYISLLLVCGDCPLTSNTGRCWNLLESTPSRITLIKSIHKRTRSLFIISNSKHGIWIFSQPRIYPNSRSNLYDVLTIDHKRIFPNKCTKQQTQNILKTKYHHYIIWFAIYHIYIIVACLWHVDEEIGFDNNDSFLLKGSNHQWEEEET